jgi:serine/threonine protein kinase
MENEIIYSYEPLWGQWKIENYVGSGSVGKVYKISRDVFNKKHYAAVKVMTIPTQEQYDNFISSLGSFDNSKKYFEDLAKQIANEINLLYELKGHSNIIAYEDHMIENINDKWHILIRMEYIQSLKDYLKNETLTKENIIKLGIDICNALIHCHKKNILHRDIKEENLFVSDNFEFFKLGDFSVSKEYKSLNSAKTKVGTLNYMPAEVIKGESYNKNVDLYSLGLVLYKLLNKNRLPFLPKYPENITLNDVEQAYFKRISGTPLDNPLEADSDLSKIIKKSCSYLPKNRYQSAEEMKMDLEKLLKPKSSIQLKKIEPPKKIHDQTTICAEPDFFKNKINLDKPKNNNLDTMINKNSLDNEPFKKSNQINSINNKSNISNTNRKYVSNNNGVNSTNNSRNNYNISKNNYKNNYKKKSSNVLLTLGIIFIIFLVFILIFIIGIIYFLSNY